MYLNIKTDGCKKFIDDVSVQKLLSQAKLASETLWSGAGRGNDFLGWTTLADGNNNEELDKIRASAERIRESSDVLIVIGVGGSYIGARAALSFIKSENYNVLSKNTPEVYFTGKDFSGEELNNIISIIGNKNFSVNVISKSGTTTEPAVAFRVFRNLLERKYGRRGAANRIIATTDKSRGALKTLADREGYETFVIPDDVGGRYSVFSPVGLLPLAVAGIDIDAMLRGAKEAMEAGKNSDAEKNPALLYAAVRNGLYRLGKKIEIFSAFDPQLQYTGEWWKQLFGESEGKEGRGIFPASANYTTDLHSLGQYIQQGERHMFETFIKVENSALKFEIPSDPEDMDGLNYMAGRDIKWANHRAMEATMTAHIDGGVPGILVNIKDLSAESFGELAGFFEVACAISGYMLGINPFDQPGVEDYKKNMFALLGKPGYEELKASLEKRR